jgi:hypothetical protein
MEKFLVKQDIGEFFSKMYQANKGKAVRVELRPDEEKVVVYYKESGTFEYIRLADSSPTLTTLVESLSK